MACSGAAAAAHIAARKDPSGGDRTHVRASASGAALHACTLVGVYAASPVVLPTPPRMQEAGRARFAAGEYREALVEYEALLCCSAG